MNESVQFVTHSGVFRPTDVCSCSRARPNVGPKQSSSIIYTQFKPLISLPPLRLRAAWRTSAAGLQVPWMTTTSSPCSWGSREGAWTSRGPSSPACCKPEMDVNKTCSSSIVAFLARFPVKTGHFFPTVMLGLLFLLIIILSVLKLLQLSQKRLNSWAFIF